MSSNNTIRKNKKKEKQNNTEKRTKKKHRKIHVDEYEKKSFGALQHLANKATKVGISFEQLMERKDNKRNRARNPLQ